jgi:hypothetical protein
MFANTRMDGGRLEWRWWMPLAKCIARSVFAATERDVRRRLRELVMQREAGVIAPGARETMARFLASCLEGVKPTL